MKLEALADGIERVAEAVLAIVERDQLDVGAQQILVRRDDAEVRQFGGLDGGVGSDVAHQQLVGAGAVGVAQKAQAAGGVGLRIAVDQQGRGLAGGKGGSQVNGGGRLADSALLVGDCDET